MAAFNAANPDAPGVLYRSFGVKLEGPFDDLLFFWTHLILSLVEGPNDGIVAYESMKWGDFGPVLPPGSRRGLSHSDVVDLRRMDRRGFDIRAFYKGIVEDLSSRGL